MHHSSTSTERSASARAYPTPTVALVLLAQGAGLAWLISRQGGGSAPAVVLSVACAVFTGFVLLRTLQQKTVWRASEAAAQETAAKLRAANDMLVRSQSIARIGSWEFDQRTGLLSCSQMTRELLGLAADAPLCAEQLETFVQPEDRPALREALVAALHHQQAWDLTLQLSISDGRRFWVRCLGWPLLESGMVAKLAGTIQDVDESKRLALERDQANQQLAASYQRAKQLAQDAMIATQAKSLFLAGMSHEIRTPLNGVIGFANLLQGTPLTSEQREHLQQIQQCSEGLLGVINDVLDYSKIESGGFKLEPVTFKVREFVESTIDLVVPRTVEKDIDLVFDLSSNLPELVTCDSARLRQVLLNLLNNAIKFTPTGEVYLRVDLVSLDEQRTGMRFTVRDTGIGIALDGRKHLFEAFLQGDGSLTRKFGGSGLGLAICKRIVEHMGGTIDFESTPGEGSTFWFTVPIESARARRIDETLPGATAGTNPLAGRTVLVVDDNTTNRRVLADHLRHWNLGCTLASSGSEALDILRSGVRCDFALIDMLMPGMNGVDLARAMRGLGDAGPRHRILLSSHSADLGGASAALFAATVQKPVKPGDLRELLIRLLKGTANDSAGPKTASTESFLQLGVLVAEDNPVNQRVVRLLLQRMGVTPDLANNGREAVERARSRSYDLVLMDVQMPEMDGLQATRAIRDTVASESQPMIVALTANAVAGDEEKCLASGMDAYMSKPVRPELLLQHLRRAMNRATSRRESASVS